MRLVAQGCYQDDSALDTWLDYHIGRHLNCISPCFYE